MSSGLAYTDLGFIEAYGAAWDGPDSLVSYFADSGVYTDVGGGVSAHGHDEIRRFVKGMLSFAPDSSVAFTSFLHADQFFVAEWVWSGTAAGPLVLNGRRFEPFGHGFSVSGVAVCTVDEFGKLLSHKDYWDTSVLVQQLEQAQQVVH